MLACLLLSTRKHTPTHTPSHTWGVRKIMWHLGAENYRTLQKKNLRGTKQVESVKTRRFGIATTLNPSKFVVLIWGHCKPDPSRFCHFNEFSYLLIYLCVYVMWGMNTCYVAHVEVRRQFAGFRSPCLLWGSQELDSAGQAQQQASHLTGTCSFLYGYYWWLV